LHELCEVWSSNYISSSIILKKNIQKKIFFLLLHGSKVRLNQNGGKNYSIAQNDPSWFFIFGSTGFELRASHLWSRHSGTRATPPALFALAILEIEFHFLHKLAWTTILLFRFPAIRNWDPSSVSLLCSLDDKCVPSRPTIGWDGVLRTIYQSWPWTVIFPI
jgi:hypothetical protein